MRRRRQGVELIDIVLSPREKVDGFVAALCLKSLIRRRPSQGAEIRAQGSGTKPGASLRLELINQFRVGFASSRKRPAQFLFLAALDLGEAALRIIARSAEQEPNPDASLIGLLQRAHHWRNRAEDEQGAPMEKLANEQGVTPSYFGRIVRLAYLAPDIVEAIIDGKQPVNLTASKLAKLRDLPIEWPEQRSILGFPPA